jgi:hypothetical protein
VLPAFPCRRGAALMDPTLLPSCAEPNRGGQGEEGVCHLATKRKPRRWTTGVILEARQQRRRNAGAPGRPAVADTRALVFSRSASVRPNRCFVG